MGKGLRGFVFFFVLLAVNAQAGTFNLVSAGSDALAILAKQLKAGGVERFDPYDPRLPYPQVSAVEALVNARTGAFSYYDIEFGSTVHVFKNRQGGSRFSMTVTPDHIEFSTYYAGNVAHANRFKTVYGWDYNFWCRGSYQVNKAQWDACVMEGFIAPLRIQMTGR